MTLGESDEKKKIRKKTINLLFHNEEVDANKTDSACLICLGSYINPVGTSCGHVFCWNCIEEWYLSNKHECPVCRNHLSLFDVTKCKLQDTERMEKFTKNRRVIYPGLARNYRSFGGTILEDEENDRPSYKILFATLLFFSVGWLIYILIFG